MLRSLFLILFIGTSLVSTLAQNRYTPYDELPGINKIYKPAFQSSYSGWKEMLFKYPVNFIEIENDFNNYTTANPNEKSAIIRYYKIWKRAVEPFTTPTGEIILPDLNKLQQTLYEAQKNSTLLSKSASFTNSDWTFYGPKETFWRNKKNIPADRLDPKGNPKQCPWQVNIYSLDVANSNENILFCGTETGFVNKSTNKGLTWSQVGRNYPFGRGIPAIVIHPKNPDTIYVSAGKQMHKSTDGGDTWTPLLAPDKKFNAHRLRINPDNNSQIIAAATDGLYISNNAGKTWQRKWSKPVYDVEFKPGKSSVIYGLSKNSSGKYQLVVSKNGGDSFVTDSSFPNSYNETSGGLLAVTPANPNVLYATLLAVENGKGVPFILKGTETAGTLNWVETKKGEPDGGLGGFSNGQGYFDLVLEVSPDDENLVFWGTCSLWKSTNGGVNYSGVGGYNGHFPIHPDIQDIKITRTGKTWVATDGGMNLSTDYFTDIANYTSRTKGIVGSDMWGFDQGWNEDIVVGGRYHNGNTALADFYGNKSLRMGGAESPTGWVIQGKSRHVAFNDLGNGWILPKTAESIAEGRFIFSKYPNMDEYGGRRSNLVHHPNYYGTIYVGEGNAIWETNDMGVSFNLLYQFPDKIRYFQISHKNPDVLYADIVGKGLYKSENGGKSWEQKPSLTDGSYGNAKWNGKLFFVISPYDENKIYACLQNGTWSADIGKVYRSENGGDSWVNWTGGVSEYTKCMVIQPTNNGKDLVYLFTSSKNGVQSKVYSRIEDQPNWNMFNTNYPAGIKVNLALPFYRDGKIRVGGNAGVWESPMAEPVFTPVVSQWVEKAEYNCMEDTLYFDDHSILNHTGASWEWEITPTPQYISSTTVRNPKVVLGNPGAYDVTLKVTQNGQTYSKTIPGMVTTTTCPSVDDCSNPAVLDKGEWSLIYTDSEETTGENGRATNAIDGNPATFWHSEWYYNTPAQPHEIHIDLGKEYLISNFTYLPRQNSRNGRIKDYELYISKDKTDWGTVVKKGAFESGSSPKKVSIDATSGRYIKFKSLSEQNNNRFTTIAEIDFTGCIEDETNSSTNELSKINAYPVPATTKLTIDLPQNGKSQNWNYRIVSSDGQVIKTDTFNGTASTHSFNLQNIKPGLYLLLLKNDANIIYRIKFIKNR